MVELNRCNILTLLLAFLILFSCSATAYTPLWKVEFTNTLGAYSDSFTAGAGSPAIDEYNSYEDIRQPPAPPGAYIRMQTLVGGEALKADYRSDLVIGAPKTWQIALIASDPEYKGISGVNRVTWPLQNIGNLNLKLIDYGKDNTKTNIVKTIDLKQESSYEFNADNVMGPYRYLDLIVEKTSEDSPPESPPQQQQGSGGGSGGGSSRTERGCSEAWKCTEWKPETCPSTGKQTRACADNNNCGTGLNKPNEEKACFYSAPDEQKEETKEEKLEQTTKTGAANQEIKESSGLTGVTGAAVSQNPEPSIFIGLTIIAAIIGIGLIIFYFAAKK